MNNEKSYSIFKKIIFISLGLYTLYNLGHALGKFIIYILN